VPEAAKAQKLEGGSDGDRNKLVLADSLRHLIPKVNRGNIFPKQPHRYFGSESDVGSV
jgi:hypothetical protein